MSILLTILYIIAGLIALLLILALLAPKRFSVTREITINRPRPEVFNFAKMIKNQELYSVWVMRDPNVNTVYTGVDGTVGAMSSWTSNHKNVGVGEQEIMKLKEGERIEVEVRFKKPMESTGYGTTILEDAGNGSTKLSWNFSGKSKYPFNLMNVMMDKMLGKDIQQNLENMKAIMEK